MDKNAAQRAAVMGLIGPVTLARALPIFEGRREACAVLRSGSKSFALAGALLGNDVKEDAAVLYAWCRRADDRIGDRIDGHDAVAGLRSIAALRRELDAVYVERSFPRDPLLAAFCEVIHRREIPRDYPEALLDGFAMDVSETHYDTLVDLDRYAYRVAGVVGLMMCHILGATSDKCLPHAAHLGMAMQLTNICRDVSEDSARGRCYLPRQLLGTTLPPNQIAPIVATLLARADWFYESGQRCLRHLDWRSALAVAAATRIHRAIGKVIEGQNHNVLAGRAIVPFHRKLWLALSAAAAMLADMPRRTVRRLLGKQPRRAVPTTILQHEDIALTGLTALAAPLPPRAAAEPRKAELRRPQRH